ncbi:MAG: DUF2922 domain-containing protein [Paraclostridium sp.]
MNYKVKLVMTFLTQDDRKVSLSIDDPRQDLSERDIKDVMDLVVAKDIFAPNGEKLVGLVEAKVVATDTTEYDLIVG